MTDKTSEDIVERLEARTVPYRSWGAETRRHDELCQEAAAEIKRLRDERDKVLRLNAPDASPDDPAVTNLDIYNSVRDWMVAGYRLHHRVKIDETIDLAKADNAALREALKEALVGLTKEEEVSISDMLSTDHPHSQGAGKE